MATYLLPVICAFNYFIIAHGSNVTLDDVLFSGSYEYIDLTFPFDRNTVFWPDMDPFAFTRTNAGFQSDGSWFVAKNFRVGEHVGTHIDAPYHFQVDGLRVGSLPLDKLIASLIIVDVSSEVNDNPNFVLRKHHLNNNLTRLLNETRGKPCVIIFKFGWSKYFNDRKKYLGIQPDDTLNFPGLSPEVAEWITSSYKNVVGMGADTASVDPGSSVDVPVHKINAEAGLYGMDNVKLDTAVPESGCTALIMPMDIALGSGAPLRLVAICPKRINTKNQKRPSRNRMPRVPRRRKT